MSATLRQVAYLEQHPVGHGHPLPPFGRVAGGEEVIDNIDLTVSAGPALDVLEVE